MNEWISPIDRHRHYGDAGRAECAVCCLEADRDHWRALARREAADRDRLRAVVDVTLEIVDAKVEGEEERELEAWIALGGVLARLPGADDDPLHPLMPTGEDQVFRDWLDFVERVARPIVETENDDAVERAAMVLYRKASPFFICAALVMAAAERDRLRAGIMTAEVHGEMIVRMRESVWLRAEAERDALRTGLLLVTNVTDIDMAQRYAQAALEAADQLDGTSEATDG